MLDDLNEDGIRTFAEYRGAENVDRLVDEIRRKNLFAVASRPFDLEGIIEKWKDDGELGSRLEVLSHGIDNRLAEIDPRRARQQPLNRERARKGSRSLAAAVVLTGDSGIRVPMDCRTKKGSTLKRLSEIGILAKSTRCSSEASSMTSSMVWFASVIAKCANSSRRNGWPTT